MTRWLRPPELERTRGRDQFDPVVEGRRYGLSRELSTAIWERVNLDATDTVRRNEEQDRRRFHELVVRIAGHKLQLRPNVGKTTRVGVEVDGVPPPVAFGDVLATCAPGRETLVTAEARRWIARNGNPTTRHDVSTANEPSTASRALAVEFVDTRHAVAQHEPPGAVEVARAIGALQTPLPPDQETQSGASSSGRSVRLLGFSSSEIGKVPGRSTTTEAPKTVTKDDEIHSTLAPVGSALQERDWLTVHLQHPQGATKQSAPGPRPLAANAANSLLTFTDCRVLGLQEMLHWLGPGHPLRQETIVAAATVDRPIANRAVSWNGPLPDVSTAGGQALWHVAERHAATLYRRAVSSGVVDQHEPAVEIALQQRGTGQPLPMELRREMEHALGVALNGVRIHTDSVATQAARILSAEAFTIGEDIFFAEGMFAPTTRSGRKLIAHELTHVAQALRGDIGPGREGLQVSQPNDPLEQEAETVAEHIDRAPASLPPLGSAARNLVRTPSALNDGKQTERPVAVGKSSTQTIYRNTKGEQVVNNAHTNHLDPDASVKADVDVMKAGLKEIKANKSVTFNRDAVKKRIESALKTLGKSSDLKAVEAEWDTLIKDRAKAGTTAYVKQEKAFFSHFETPLAKLTTKYPKSQAKYWLKNTPSKIVDEIIAAADTGMPADQLYVYAMKEGLDKYIRSEAGVSGTDDPTATQLDSVSTNKSISGFSYLGTDDFFTELTASYEPLTKHLPAGYDVKKATLDPHVNEHGRTVQSAIFPNLKMGLQALSATMKRRRALFLTDVGKHGYAKPTTDELVYWTYVYYNSGEFNEQLKKHKGKRVLNDWIAASEFPNAIKVLQSWRMIKEMKIF